MVAVYEEPTLREWSARWQIGTHRKAIASAGASYIQASVSDTQLWLLDEFSSMRLRPSRKNLVRYNLLSRKGPKFDTETPV